MRFRLLSVWNGVDLTDSQRVIKLVSDDEKVVLHLFFSYETLIGCNGCISENKWSQATGRFIGKLEPDAKNRAPHDYVLKFASEKLKEIADSDAIAREKKRLEENMGGEKI
jgi:hypothetical protein